MAMTVGIFILVCARAAATRTSCEGTSSAHSDGSIGVHHGFHRGGIALPIWLAVNHSWNGTNGRYDNNDKYANPAQFHRGGDNGGFSIKLRFRIHIWVGQFSIFQFSSQLFSTSEQTIWSLIG